MSPLPHLDLPHQALSVRQPWAWAIIHAGKDIENRSWQAVNHGLTKRGRIAIHAAKGLTREEYVDASEFMLRDLHIACPPAHELLRGGIIGSVDVVDVVRWDAANASVVPAAAKWMLPAEPARAAAAPKAARVTTQGTLL